MGSVEVSEKLRRFDYITTQDRTPKSPRQGRANNPLLANQSFRALYSVDTIVAKEELASYFPDAEVR